MEGVVIEPAAFGSEGESITSRLSKLNRKRRIFFCTDFKNSSFFRFWSISECISFCCSLLPEQLQSHKPAQLPQHSSESKHKFLCHSFENSTSLKYSTLVWRRRGTIWSIYSTEKRFMAGF